MPKLSSIVSFLVASTICFAQPLIAPRWIVNGASFMTRGLPAGSIAQGSLFTIFGVRLGPSSSPSLSFPLATHAGWCFVKITQGTTSVQAIPVFVSGAQINVIMPSNAPLGRVCERRSFSGHGSRIGASAAGRDGPVLGRTG